MARAGFPRPTPMTIHTRSMLRFRAVTLVVTLAAASLWMAYPHARDRRSIPTA